MKNIHSTIWFLEAALKNNEKLILQTIRNNAYIK